jgi:ABC-type nitrate/sulfonate/bicarbonate transport system substrate-binding protein
MSRRIEYGVPSDQSGMAVRFGVAKGFFAGEGLDLSVRTIFGGPELAAAIDSGEVKIGEVGSPPGITAIGEGKRLKIVGSSIERGLGFFLLTAPLFETWVDLRGARAGGLSRGSCGYWYLRQILAQRGLILDQEVSFRELGADYHNQIELLRSGEINVMLSTEPYCSLGQSLGVAKFWGGVGELTKVPTIQWMVVVAQEDFLRQEPQIVQAVLRASRRSSRYAVRHLDQWIDFSAQHFGITREIAERAVRRELPHHHFDGELDLPGLGRAIELQHELGAIPRVLSLDEVADLRFQPVEA